MDRLVYLDTGEIFSEIEDGPDTARLVAVVSGDLDDDTHKVGRVLAAGPELLECLDALATRALEYIGEFDGTFDPRMDCDAEMRKLALAGRSAIERAKGGAE